MKRKFRTIIFFIAISLTIYGCGKDDEISVKESSDTESSQSDENFLVGNVYGGTLCFLTDKEFVYYWAFLYFDSKSHVWGGIKDVGNKYKSVPNSLSPSEFVSTCPLRYGSRYQISNANSARVPMDNQSYEYELCIHCMQVYDRYIEVSGFEKLSESTITAHLRRHDNSKRYDSTDLTLIKLN